MVIGHFFFKFKGIEIFASAYSFLFLFTYARDIYYIHVNVSAYTHIKKNYLYQ